MKRFVCIALAAAALPMILAGTAHAQSQTKEGTIIWSNPKTAGSANAAPAPRPTTGTPDKTGIIWSDPAPAAVPPAPSAPASTANAVPKTFPPNASASVNNDTVIWDTPPRRAGNAIAAAVQPGPCREFQTEIVIDGRKQPARGTACRQPDGTWKVVNR